MPHWNDGYITEIEYTSGYYDDLEPVRLAFAVLAKGYRPPRIDVPFSYCELGCGKGLTATIVAAANPNARVWANDFNPTHVAGAKALAADVPNLTFSDASFASAMEEIPEETFDFIVLHGIYSWISEENRQNIVTFIENKLKIGGLVYISYNSAPGWASAAPAAELMRLYAEKQGAGSILEKFQASRDFVKSVAGLDALFFKGNGAAQVRLDEMSKKDSKYLVHEYLNSDWNMLLHSEVLNEVTRAKVSFVCGSNLMDQLPHLNMMPEQIKFLDQIKDPVLREVTIDYIVNQQFRRDVFIKGPIKLHPHELDDAWMDLRFASSRPPSTDDLKPKLRMGEASLRPEVYTPLMELIDRGPITVREMLQKPNIALMGLATLKTALVTLAAIRRIAPALDAEGEAARRENVATLNDQIFEQSRSTATTIPMLASPVVGGGVHMSRLDQVFLFAERTGLDPVDHAWKTIQKSSELMMRGDVPLVTEKDNVDELGSRYKIFSENRKLRDSLGFYQ